MNNANEIEDEVQFTVEGITPPSVNHYKVPCVYRASNGRRVKGFKLTAEAKAFKTWVCVMARGRTVAPATKRERDKVRYRIIIDVYLGPNERLDADNGPKLCLDGLEDAGVIHSDAFVGDLRVRPHKDERQNPRTVFYVSRMKEDE